MWMGPNADTGPRCPRTKEPLPTEQTWLTDRMVENKTSEGNDKRTGLIHAIFLATNIYEAVPVAPTGVVMKYLNYYFIVM
jgi:hypothetical protein